jgi:hypothetical protein
VEILVEEDKILPVRIVPVAWVLAVAWSSALGILEKELDQSAFYFVGDFSEVSMLAGSGRTFHGETIAIVFMVGSQRCDDQVVQWEPDWTSPIAVATEHARVALAGYVTDRVGPAGVFEDERFVLMDRRKRADSVRG